MVAVFDQPQLSGANPVVLELITKLEEFEAAAAELEAAEQELQHVLTSLFAQYSEEEAAAMLEQIGEATGLDTAPFKPSAQTEEVTYIE